MDPPSYNAQSVAPYFPPAPTAAIATITSLPPYHPTPTTPPPTYGEAVTMQTDPFPVLTPPTRQSLPNQEQTGYFFHQSTQIVNTETVRQQPIPTVVIIQSEAVGQLGDAPCTTQCSNCGQRVTTVVVYRPGVAAWAMCGLITLLGFICGCCLIPLLVPGFQDAHHSCPLCHAHLHVHTRM
ncbi:lipopolysaccharide-induced tumor necrosis factor-alpha factor homolog [Salmo salar]|uniref:Lipopolysaccharide-induced tumor necrosis factor-alpha factor homolog n=1 Tax=Salmo salar TaxID=8030 RepID=A0ABM3EBR7_SALSA|nr:lipopolysaccharide-induced tumor necrosis factor-alpha factor homolog [Salmo salar]|eukprot:XP_014047860.1 PREDICTED: lipopolysaccharide-induced tumor necrosis factor-alpha factor homolog [Salmo salar]